MDSLASSWNHWGGPFVTAFMSTLQAVDGPGGQDPRGNGCAGLLATALRYCGSRELQISDSGV